MRRTRAIAGKFSCPCMHTPSHGVSLPAVTVPGPDLHRHYAAHLPRPPSHGTHASHPIRGSPISSPGRTTYSRGSVPMGAMGIFGMTSASVGWGTRSRLAIMPPFLCGTLQPVVTGRRTHQNQKKHDKTSGSSLSNGTLEKAACVSPSR